MQWSAPVTVPICRHCDAKIERLRALTRGAPGAFAIPSVLCSACAERFEALRDAATKAMGELSIHCGDERSDAAYATLRDAMSALERRSR